MKRLICCINILLSVYLYGQWPNDPIRTKAFELINAPQAWALTKGNPKIRIAIVDQSFNKDHEDLKNQIAITNGSSYGEESHGTMIAGIAAAEPNNGIGLCGMGYNSKLALYAIGKSGILMREDSVLIRDATKKAVNDENKIVCVSFASTGLSTEEAKKIVKDGTTLVLAAGNTTEFISHKHLKDIPGVIIVGAVDSMGHLAMDCTRHEQVDIYAPGNGFTSSCMPPLLYYPWWSPPATSYSVPFVAGTIALMKAVNPALTPEDIDSLLKKTGTETTEGYSTFKRLDAEAAVLGAIQAGTTLISGEWYGYDDKYFYAPSLLEIGNQEDLSDPYYDVTIQEGIYTQFETHYAVDFYPGFTVLDNASIDVDILEYDEMKKE